MAERKAGKVALHDPSSPSCRAWDLRASQSKGLFSQLLKAHLSKVFLGDKCLFLHIICVFLWKLCTQDLSNTRHTNVETDPTCSEWDLWIVMVTRHLKHALLWPDQLLQPVFPENFFTGSFNPLFNPVLYQVDQSPFISRQLSERTQGLGCGTLRVHTHLPFPIGCFVLKSKTYMHAVVGKKRIIFEILRLFWKSLAPKLRLKLSVLAQYFTWERITIFVSVQDMKVALSFGICPVYCCNNSVFTNTSGRKQTLCVDSSNVFCGWVPRHKKHPFVFLFFFSFCDQEWDIYNVTHNKGAFGKADFVMGGQSPAVGRLGGRRATNTAWDHLAAKRALSWV